MLEVLRRVLTDVANELRDRSALNEEECFSGGARVSWARSLTVKAIDPFADGLRGRIELARSRGFGHAAIRNGTHHFLSTFRGQASILMGVHSALRESLRFGNISVPGMDNPRKFTTIAIFEDRSGPDLADRPSLHCTATN
jgi:hypothetical protein